MEEYSLRPKGPPPRRLAPVPPPRPPEGLSPQAKRIIGLLSALFAVSSAALSFASGFWGKTQAAALAYDRLATDIEVETAIGAAIEGHKHAPRDIDNPDISPHPPTERALRRVEAVTDSNAQHVHALNENMYLLFGLQLSYLAADLERNPKLRAQAARKATRAFQDLLPDVRSGKLTLQAAKERVINTDPYRLR